MLPTERFSSRVADYVKYRPSYPRAIITHLTSANLLTPHSIIADIGSGTGLLTQLFLDHDNHVFAIEPNPDMRTAGEQFLAPYKNLTSLNATAEATTLPDHSIDLITAGQAFHWFNRDATRKEFARILKPDGGGGTVALIWNDRLANTPFLLAYDDLLKQFSTDYQKVDHRQITDAVIEEFFTPNPVTLTTFENAQHFDYDSLHGRLLSSSYAPQADHPNHTPMLTHLQKIFNAHQQNNQVSFTYQTKLYTAQLRT